MMKRSVVNAMHVDLHIHTTASDSCWTPQNVVDGVLRKGIGLFAITDHDTVAHVLDTEALAKIHELGFLRGVEISCLDDKTFYHVLGYGIAVENAELRALIEENRARALANDAADVKRLIERGFPMDLDEYREFTYDQTLGGFKLYRYACEKGLCSDLKEFNRRVRGAIGFRFPDFVHPAAACAVIRAAGGIPILAHPLASFKSCGGLVSENLRPLEDIGIAGLECYSQYHDNEATQTCLTWCRARDLLITGGSDYHGGFVNRELGYPRVMREDLVLGPLNERVRDISARLPAGTELA
jgi:hypothetical protein